MGGVSIAAVWATSIRQGLCVVCQSQTQAWCKGLVANLYWVLYTCCRNIAVQSDYRTCNYNILTSGENSRLCYSWGFVKRYVVTMGLRSSQSLTTELHMHDDPKPEFKNLNVIIAFLLYKMQYWLATTLGCECKFEILSQETARTAFQWQISSTIY